MIRNVECLFLLVASLLLAPAQAAELKVPEPFDVLSVNGADYSAILQTEKTLTLQPGRNVIILEYDQIFDADFGDSHDRIRSAPFALVFDLGTHKELRIVDPKLESGTEARRYASAPKVQLQDQNHQPVANQLLSVRELDGVLLVNNPTSASTVTTQAASPQTTTAAVAPVSATASVAATPAVSATQTAPAKPAPATDAPANAPDALNMLNFWWQQATPEQRAAFLQNIVR